MFADLSLRRRRILETMMKKTLDDIGERSALKF